MPAPVILDALEVTADKDKEKDSVAGGMMKTLGKLNVFG